MTLTRTWRILAVAFVAMLLAAFAQPPKAAQAASRWRIEHRNFASMCLDGNNAGGQAYLWQCVSATNQYYYFDLVEGLYYRLRNAKTGRCVGSNGVHGDSPIYNLACDGNWATHWSVVFAGRENGRDYYKFQPRYVNGYCITPSDEYNGSGIVMRVCQTSFDDWTWYQM
ncbi:RICIN domain-containing protein [Actinoplanes sp. NPDC049596]|uniref:RICIN domain-containing protein n=1 Tax=unclassified Actinoplanes TaxID=2626549 RepID=UPI0034174AC0